MAKWLLAYIITLILFPKIKPYVSNIIDNEYGLDISLGIAIFGGVIFLVLLINKGIGLLSFLSPEFLNLTKSNSESRRYVKSNAIKINGKTISDEKYILNLSDFKQKKDIEISLGKKKKIIVRVEE